MNEPQRFQLIDGTFAPSAARKVLLDLVRSKIDYHEKEKFSDQFRFGPDVSHAQGRLDELYRLNDELTALLDTAAREGADLKVNGWIEVTSTRNAR